MRVRYPHEGLERQRHDGQLLVDFAQQGIIQAFAVFDMPTRETPAVRVILPVRTSSRQENALRSNKDGIDDLSHDLLHSIGTREAVIMARMAIPGKRLNHSR